MRFSGVLFTKAIFFAQQSLHVKMRVLSWRHQRRFVVGHGQEFWQDPYGRHRSSFPLIIASSNGEGGSSTSLAEWAEQLGQSDMLTSLSASLANDSATTRRHDDDEAGNPDADASHRGDTGETGSSHGAEEAEGERSRVWGDGGRGTAADDVGLFVEELRVGGAGVERAGGVVFATGVLLSSSLLLVVHGETLRS